MLYSTQAQSKKAGRRTVWIWFALSLLSLTALGLAYLIVWPGEYPPQSNLVKVGGDLRTSLIRDDITNSGSMLPVFSSVYLRFHGDDREYRYPWQHAQFYYVREYTFFNIDIWVDKNDLERDDGQAVKIWALEEHNPHDSPEDQTIVTYQENIEQLEKNADSVIRLAKWLGGAGIFLLAGGIWTIRWNRRNYPDP